MARRPRLEIEDRRQTRQHRGRFDKPRPIGAPPPIYTGPPFESKIFGSYYGVHIPNCDDWWQWLCDNLGPAGERWSICTDTFGRWVTFKTEDDLLRFANVFQEEERPKPPEMEKPRPPTLD